MTTIPQLPLAASAGPGDLLPLSQNGALFAVSVAQLTANLQPILSVPTGDLLGRSSTGSGSPEAIAVGTGLSLAGAALAATGADHAAFPLHVALTLSDDIVLSSSGQPGLLPVTGLRGLFSAGANINIDPNGVISVTNAGLIGPAGPAGIAGPIGPAGPAGATGPQGAGLVAPGPANSASSIAGTDMVAIWQNGANAWLSYAQLIGGQTIDQLAAAGPASDSDELLVAQGGNALTSQSFGAVWNYIAGKLPAYKTGLVELTSNTVLDGTNHNGRILIASQPLILSANFANMGPGFTCQLINLSAGAVTMGTGITAPGNATILTPGSNAVLFGLSYSGGSLVWWNGNSQNLPILTVNTITAPAVGSAFTVSGGLFNDAPISLDYTTDNITWLPASGAIITTNNYNFTAPGLPAGNYTLRVRDHGNMSVIGVSNSFNIAAASIEFTNLPTTLKVGAATVITGMTSPSNSAVSVGISTSATIAPTSFVSATTTGGTWTASITPSTTGTVFLWAQQSSNITIQTVSPAIAVISPSLTITAPASGTAGTALAMSGSVSPASDLVNVQLATQNTTAPTSGYSAAIVNAGLFNLSLIPAGAGTYYAWAQDPATLLSAVSQAITVSAAASGVTYSINQPSTTSYSHGSGTIGLNGSVTPAQNMATQVALSASNTSAPTSGWQPAAVINNFSLWAVYYPVPTTPGVYYVWVQTQSGADNAVSSFALTVT